MPTFRYKAISRDGAQVTGVVDAYDKLEAVNQIKQTCPVVTSVEPVLALSRTKLNFSSNRRISDKALALVSSQFAIILKTGLPVIRAVQLIAEQTSDDRLKKLLGQAAEDVAAGYGLAASLENKGKAILPATFIETVRAGEESGTLSTSFAKLHTYYDRADKVHSKARSAMMYPIFLIVLAVIVIAIIMVVTMPTFQSVFESMDMELPGLTRGLIAAANFFTRWWWLLLLLVICAVLALRVYKNTESGGLKLAKLALHLPALGHVNRMKGASQFANTLSTLLTAGIPLISAVETVGRVLDNRYLGRCVGELIPLLEEGQQLGDNLRKTNAFPSMLCEMTAMGEETGSLEGTLDTIGEYYDAETELASNRALAVLQPAITVVMGVIIGIIVIGLYLPMFTMYNGM